MPSLRATHEIFKTHVLLVLEGRFDPYDSDNDLIALQNAYDLIRKETAQTDLILEFKMKHIGSVGINTLIKVYQMARTNDGRLIFIQFPDSEIRYLEITGFNRYVSCLQNRTELF